MGVDKADFDAYRPFTYYGRIEGNVNGLRSGGENTKSYLNSEGVYLIVRILKGDRSAFEPLQH